MMPLVGTDAGVDSGGRLSPGVWVGAGLEILVALAVGMLIVRTGAPSTPSRHGMPGAAHAHPHSLEVHWHPSIFIVAGLTATMLIWWLTTRARVPAVLAATGLIVVATSETARVMAADSHLVAMAALEVLLVAVPLLVIAALGRGVTIGSGHSAAWITVVAIAVALYSLLLIGLHLPAVYRHGADLGIVPFWLTVVVVVIGLSYWAAILGAVGRVRPAVRRGALIIGQEVAAILGLAALLMASPHEHHINSLGLSASVDHRLGGALMLVTCAAVTLPLAKRLGRQQEAH